MAAGKVGLFQGLLNLVKSNPGALQNAGVSAVLNTIVTGAATGDPVTGLKYGLADFALSYPATLAVRKFRPKGTEIVTNPKTGETRTQEVTSKLELPANFAASTAANLLMGMTEAPVQQQQQIAQQALQRDAINQTGLIAGMPNAYSPGTMFQMQGMEPTYARSIMQQVMQQDPVVDMADMERNMARIVGV